MNNINLMLLQNVDVLFTQGSEKKFFFACLLEFLGLRNI